MAGNHLAELDTATDHEISVLNSSGTAFRVIASLVVCAGFTLLLIGRSSVIIATSLCLGVALVPLVVRVFNYRTDVFEPVTIFATSFAFLFVARPFYEAYRGTYDQPLLGHDYGNQLPTALVVAAIGALAFYAGYFCWLGRSLALRLPVPKDAWSLSRLRVVTRRLLIVSLAAFSLFVLHSGGLGFLASLFNGRNTALGASLGSSSGYLYTAPFWIEASGVLYLLLTKRWFSTRAVPGWLLLLYSLITSIGPGSRSYFLPALLSLVLMAFLRKDARPRLGRSLVAVVVVFFVGVSAPRDYRNVGAAQKAQFGSALAKTVTHPGDALDGLLGGADTAMVDSFATEIGVVPNEVPLTYGKTYLEALTRPIPRFIWHDKPRAADTILNEQIYPATSHHVGFAFSIFGEPYLNAGIVGVALVMFVYGFIMRAQWLWLQRSPRNLTLIAIYAITVPYVFVFMRGGFGVDYQQEIIAIVPLWVAYRYVFKGRRNGTAGPLDSTMAAN